MGTVGYLNDLWVFNITSRSWTWIGGSQVNANSIGTYPAYIGGIGVPASRGQSAFWKASNGALYIFSGGARLGFTINCSCMSQLELIFL